MREHQKRAEYPKFHSDIMKRRAGLSGEMRVRLFAAAQHKSPPKKQRLALCHITLT
jgi:hypothetical protein